MRIRSTGLILVAGLSIIVGACSSAASSSAPASSAPESAAPASEAPASSAPASEAPASSAPSSDLKIGVVTDVGMFLHHLAKRLE